MVVFPTRLGKPRQPPYGRIVQPRIDLLGTDWFMWCAHTPGVGRTRDLIESRAGIIAALPRYSPWGGISQSFTRTISAGVGTGIWDFFAPPTAADGFTVAVVAAPRAQAAMKTAVTYGNSGASPFCSNTLGFNCDETYNVQSGAIILFSRNTAGTEVGVKALNALDGQYHSFVAGNSSAASSGYILRDGIALPLSVNTSMTGTYSGFTERIHIGNLSNFSANTNYIMDDPLLLVIFWRKRLSPYQAAVIGKMLIDNPFSIFETKVKSWWFKANASGSTGTLAATNQNDSLTAAGSPVLVGTLAATNANDTLSASGATTVTGTLSVTHANDSLSASGSVGSPVSGSLSATNADDTLSASGTTTVRGTLAVTNANDSLSSSGTTTVTGTLASTNVDDGLTASGSVGSAVSGSAAVTNQDDTMSASGTTTARGTAGLTNADDSMTAAGNVGVRGSASVTNADDTMVASGVSGTPASAAFWRFMGLVLTKLRL